MTTLRSLMTSNTSLICLASFMALTAASACGGDDNGNGDGDGDGDGDTGTGASANSGGSPGSGGDDATGGAGGNSGGDTATGGDGATGGANGTGGNGMGGAPFVLNYNCEPPVGEVPELALEIVQSGFNEPVLVTHAPDDERLFVVQRGGLIRIIDGNAIQAEPFLDLTQKALSGGQEQGLLGLAFHPSFSSNGLFYVYYTAAGDGRSVVEEYSLADGSTTVANPGSARLILEQNQPATVHNGGQVAFGPDGMLYLALGDSLGYQIAQDVTALLGSLLRIDVNGRDAGAYSIPSGNLQDVMPSAAPEIYSYGFRNPYRYTFDGCTGDLYVGDVGQDNWEEVTITRPGVGHINYGWPTMEGAHCFSPATDCDQTGLTLPQVEYTLPGAQAMVGGSVYRGSAIPGLRGKYFYADAQDGKLWYSEYNSVTNTAATPVDISVDVGVSGSIVAIQNGFDGELYLANRGDGNIYKLIEYIEPD